MSRSVELIGGPHCGQFAVVKDDQTSIRVPVVRRHSATWKKSTEEQCAAPIIDHYVYTERPGTNDFYWSPFP